MIQFISVFCQVTIRPNRILNAHRALEFNLPTPGKPTSGLRHRIKTNGFGT